MSKQCLICKKDIQDSKKYCSRDCVYKNLKGPYEEPKKDILGKIRGYLEKYIKKD